MSIPNPSVIDPMPVYNLEVNGPANIIMMIRASVGSGKPLDTSYIRLQARLFDTYVEKLEQGRSVSWCEHLVQEARK
jgi:hypothetical protein